MAQTKDYSRLPSEEGNGIDGCPDRASFLLRFRIISYVLGILLSWLAMLALGYLLGLSINHTSALTAYQPVGDLHYYMHFNGSFAQRSDSKSDSLWDSLFPEKLGFVKHPKLAPNVAGVAVFHELHCLNILRVAYFASLDGTLAELGGDDQEANHRTSSHHIRHCFEYLRQSLICLADSNLEDMNYTARGISGWQTERTCRNFEGLKTWADQWGITREEALHDWDREIHSINP
ncbi:hypothetical protein F5B22DRAFT_176711 [Xylaria bambusicola]|uniref:uncharacterized protein n=1 Tax=Xylaria bambusicola TaxID=326684 RepID=UPI0020071F7F|nr:uncharacterized protein F5B22DRAFT_176711 [Xylaria bambusicola]KAI0516713.1 hypothetical protein F5B22DRAFT_176711 [Xylaria bambusicola]